MAESKKSEERKIAIRSECCNFDVIFRLEKPACDNKDSPVLPNLVIMPISPPVGVPRDDVEDDSAIVKQCNDCKCKENKILLQKSSKRIKILEAKVAKLSQNVCDLDSSLHELVDLNKELIDPYMETKEFCDRRCEEFSSSNEPEATTPDKESVPHPYEPASTDIPVTRQNALKEDF